MSGKPKNLKNLENWRSLGKCDRKRTEKKVNLELLLRELKTLFIQTNIFF